VGWCNSIPETRDPKPVLNIEVSLYCKSYDLTCVKTSEALTDIDRNIDQFFDQFIYRYRSIWVIASLVLS
jgi:hypothetical protein